MPLPDTVRALAGRGSDYIHRVYNNAPLLRFINPNNRYNLLSTGESNDPSRTRTIDGHLVHVADEATDGVFSNLTAKPSNNNATVITDHLPSYDEASHDPTPPYWETSVMSEFDEIYIDGIPVGNIFNFLWSTLVSVLFQFLGFVITYLLHTSHAAKNGSQVGLGLTIINLAIASLPVKIGKNEIDTTAGRFEPTDPAAIDASVSNNNVLVGSLDDYHSSLQNHGEFTTPSDGLFDGTPMLAAFLFIVGGFIITKAIYDFYKVKRLEYSIMFPSNSSNLRATTSNGNNSDEEGIELNATPNVAEQV